MKYVILAAILLSSTATTDQDDPLSGHPAGFGYLDTAYANVDWWVAAPLFFAMTPQEAEEFLREYKTQGRPLCILDGDEDLDYCL